MGELVLVLLHQSQGHVEHAADLFHIGDHVSSCAAVNRHVAHVQNFPKELHVELQLFVHLVVIGLVFFGPTLTHPGDEGSAEIGNKEGKCLLRVALDHRLAHAS